MLTTFVVAGSIALSLTAAFTFRFRMWRRPAVVLGYFLTFLVLEWVAEAFFLPPGTLGPEVAMLCLPLALVFGGAIVWARRLEASAGPEEGGGPR